MKTLLTLVLLSAAVVSLSALSLTPNHLLSENTFHLASSQDLTLSLDVAARDQASRGLTFPLSVSYLNIYWNDVLVSKWNAPDYDIHHLQFKVTPKNGTNTLSFSVPTSTFGGSCFSNVSLKGPDGKQLVVNGNFNAVFGQYQWSAYSSTNNLKGWNTLNQYGAGLGSIFNPRFPSSVAALGNTAPSVYQTFDIKVLPVDKNQLYLSVDVAARDQAARGILFPLNKSWLQIYWNGALISDWIAPDYEVHHLQFYVSSRNGLNSLSFSIPQSPFGGACLSNVSLLDSDDQELIVNGQFKTKIGSNGHQGFTRDNHAQGWNTLSKYTIGLPSVFNKRFKSNVVALNSQQPSIYQTVEIKQKN